MKQAKAKVAFTLSMPGRASWDGRWSGEDRLYCIVQAVPAAKAAELDGKSWTYRWSDGWAACVEAKVVDAAEARGLRRKSAGFSGYDWMVQSILSKGRIRAAHEDDGP